MIRFLKPCSAYFSALLIIIIVYGTIPFLSIPPLIQIMWASGFAQSFVNAGWPAIKAINFGLPYDAAIPFGLPAVFLQSTFMYIFGMHASDAYAAGAVLWLALALWGGIRFCQLLGTSFTIGAFLSLIFLTLPIVWVHAFYSMVSYAFALLPLYLYIALRVIYYLPEMRFTSRDWLITACSFAVISILALFMDGYTFVMFFTASGLIWIIAFIRRDVSRKKLLSWTLPVILISAALSYSLYSRYIGLSNFPPDTMSFFRAWGIDLVMLLRPTKSVTWLWDTLGVSVTRSNNIFFGNSSVWQTTFALPLMIVGALGYYLTRKHRLALPLLLVALMGLYFSLGPSLKVNSLRPLDANGQQLVKGMLMPTDVAVMPTGNEVVYKNVPGFNSMRATYRWSGLLFLGLFGLSILLYLNLSTRNYTLVAPGIALLLIISNLPHLHTRLKISMENRESLQNLESYFYPLADYVGKDALVFFAPPDNDFIINYLASTGGYRTYNIGGDKNLEIARESWPVAIRRFYLKRPGMFFRSNISNILLSKQVDFVVIPYFGSLTLFESHYAEIIKGREAALAMTIKSFRDNPNFTVHHDPIYEVISLSR